MKIKTVLNIIVLLFSVVVLVGCTQPSTDEVDKSYVIFEINPSFEVVLTDNDVVNYVSPINEDGEVLLLNLELEGMPVEEAIEVVIDKATELGFINPEAEETVVEVTTVTEDQQEKEELEEKIKNKVDNIFLDRGMRGLARMKQINTEIIAEAEELGVEPGVLKLIKIAQELNPDLTLEEALEMSVKDLIEIVRVKGNEMHEIVQEFKSDFFEKRDEIRAKYQPQIEALTTQINEIIEQIENVVDDEELSILKEQLDSLQEELEILLQQYNDEITNLKNEFVENSKIIREQIRENHQQMLDEHHQKLKEFRKYVDENREQIHDQMMDWMNQRRGRGN